MKACSGIAVCELWLLLVMALLAFYATHAAKFTTSHKMEGYSRHFLLTDFGLAAGARIRLWNAVIAVVNESQKHAWHTAGINTYATSRYDCEQPSYARWSLENHGELSWLSPRSGRYSILLLQCKDNVVASTQIRAEVLNPDPRGHLTQHLPIEKTMLPNTYYALSFLFTLLAAAYIAELIIMAAHVKSLHVLFAFAILARIVELGMLYTQFEELNVHGTVTSLFLTIVQLVSHFSTAVLLTCLLCISLGLSITRDAVQVHAREVHVLVLSVVLYFVLGILAAPCAQKQFESDECVVVSVMGTIMRSLVLLITIVAMNFNVAFLKVTATSTTWNRDTTMTYTRLKQFESLRWVFIAYLLLPVIFMTIEVAVLSWEYYWFVIVMHEMLALFIFIFLGTTFRPLNPAQFSRCYDYNQEVIASHLQSTTISPMHPYVVPAA